MVQWFNGLINNINFGYQSEVGQSCFSSSLTKVFRHLFLYDYLYDSNL